MALSILAVGTVLNRCCGFGRRTPSGGNDVSRRSILRVGKTGSISRLEARSAAKAVRSARLSSGSAHKYMRDTPLSVWERYLGHFGTTEAATAGSGRHGSGPKRSMKKKSAGRTKPAAKKKSNVKRSVRVA